MNAFVASRIGAALVVLSPLVFLGLLYTAAPHDPVSIVAQLAFYYAYLAAVASFVPIRPALGERPWLAWLALSALLALPAAALRFAAGAGQPQTPDYGDAGVNAVCAIVCAAAAFAVRRAGARFDRRTALELAFPLHGGLFEAIQAGSSRLLNHHVVSRAQRYGVDLVKVGGNGLALAPPRTPAQLPTYAVEVRSALAGRVVEAVDAFDDNAVGVRDPRHPFGNHVVVEDAVGSRVFFAHLERGSVAVEPGQTVRAGDLLGRVGNSGNTTEPHLHVHAERDGAGLPMTFGGRFLIRNSSVRSA